MGYYMIPSNIDKSNIRINDYNEWFILSNYVNF